MIKIIYCIDKKNGFSKNGKLPWHIPEEFKHFKKTTLNKTIVMGRKTFESIGKKLENRNNIIFSNNKKLKIKDCIVTNDIDFIIEKSLLEDVYIIGGKEIINIFLPYAGEIIESILHKDYHADSFLEINKNYFKFIKKIKKNDFDINFYKTKILSGYILSKIIRNELILKKDELIKKFKKIPKLLIIQIGNDFASEIYIKNKIKIANKIGIEVELKKFSSNTSNDEIKKFINKANNNNLINGILIQLPLPKNLDSKKIINYIDPIKDVDCLTKKNIGNLFSINKDSFLPCTPLGVLEILKRNKIKIESKIITIVGRSNIVGKPLSLLLLNENATINISHSKTKNLKKITRNADILVSATGVKKIIKRDMIKKNAVLIDVGINRELNKICGDIDFDNVLDLVSHITPVPKGVGPVTIIMLYKNLLIAYEKQNN